jgi:HSP20 family protein
MVKLKLYTPNQVMRSFWGLDPEMLQTFGSTDTLDVYEKDGQVFIEAAVAGIQPENVHITFEEGVLRIDAKQEEHEEEKNKKGYYKNEMVREYHYNTNLPRPVEGDQITAHVEHGVVTVTAPIAEAAKPRRIEVKIK